MASTNTSHEEAAVVDANVLIDLFELDRLDLLFISFDVVCIPQIIYDKELQGTIKERIREHTFKVSNIDSEEGHATYLRLTVDRDYRNLSDHDKVAISIAKQYEYYCNSNDGLVRKACDLVGVRCLGTLGLLEKAWDKKAITTEELVHLVNELAGDNTSCYIKKTIIKGFLDKLGI